MNKHQIINEPLYQELQKFLSDQRNSALLFNLADSFIELGKRYLALLCITEAARINPTDEKVMSLYENLHQEVSPLKIEFLPPETCLVSIIVRAFKRHGSLREALSSIVIQSLQDLEVIIVNDAGDPALENIVAEFNEKLRINYVYLDTNVGQGGALDAGVRRASGRYIAYLDDDDIFYPHHLSTGIAALEENQGSDFYHSNFWWVYGEEKDGIFIENKKRANQNRPINYSRSRLLKSNFIALISVIHRRSIFSTIGSFRPDLRHNEDWEFFLRASAVTNFIQGKEYTVEYRWRTDNISLDRVSMNFFSWLIGQYYRHQYIDILELRRLLTAGQQQELLNQLIFMEQNVDVFLDKGSAMDVISSSLVSILKNGYRCNSIPRLQNACIRRDPFRFFYAGLKCNLPDICLQSTLHIPSLLRRSLISRAFGMRNAMH